MRGGERPGIMGQVTAVNGSTITVQSRGMGRGNDEGTNAAATTYTVNASGATIDKNGAASTLSAIAIGDNVMVVGTISGTTVTATTIRDGVPQGGMGRGDDQGEKQGWGMATGTRPMMDLGDHASTTRGTPSTLPS